MSAAMRVRGIVREWQLRRINKLTRGASCKLLLNVANIHHKSKSEKAQQVQKAPTFCCQHKSLVRS